MPQSKQRILFARLSTSLSLAFILLLSACASAPPVETGKVLEQSYYFELAGKDMEYRLYVPTSYKPGKPTPLVVLLHGLGSNPEQVIGYQGVTDEAEEHGFIVEGETNGDTGLKSSVNQPTIMVIGLLTLFAVIFMFAGDGGTLTWVGVIGYFVMLLTFTALSVRAAKADRQLG